MLRKLVIFILTIAICVVSPTFSTYAASSNYTALNPASGVLPSRIKGAAQQTSHFLKRCLLGQPSNGLDEIGCGALKTSIQAGLVVAICYTADGVATAVFPPASTLAPACNYLGIAKAGQKVVAH